ncbi:hypothetical protein AFUB_020870 [Aspergillus fumigatus A1163]|uniref:Uncharacterized protein n=1 Tax=Aspergillus fumigatus (strain CBS 144.89 / FGSC A1163 / CEA10) TaxID=451804 RepID=B0XUQ2_ASPFC|nr:hypothetical protein AFUB_020870 [Aspergillus fumigatus A1163]
MGGAPGVWVKSRFSIYDIPEDIYFRNSHIYETISPEPPISPIPRAFRSPSAPRAVLSPRSLLKIKSGIQDARAFDDQTIPSAPSVK